jgi:hypothetical protein
LGISALLLAQQPQASSADPWAGLRILEGRWDGESSGQPGKGKSTRECSFVLNGKYLEIRNKSTYPPQPSNREKGEVHEDWGMISYDRSRKTHVFRQFHAEGFVNQYVAEPSVVPNRIRFVSESIENIPAGYRARETWTIDGPDAFVERFELAPPGKDFVLYSETRFQRRGSAKD